MSEITYQACGVDYSAMDPFKIKCQLAAADTVNNLERLGIKEIPWSRGESAYLMEFPAGIISHVEEGLGTKNLDADEMFELEGSSFYHYMAQDTVAMMVNDIITTQTLPVSLCMHLAVANGNWFKDEKRTEALIEGWKNACNLARCAWGGGETPTLKGIIVPGTSLLSGSAVGYSKRLYTPKVKHGDAIIFLSSSGIHANGLTMAREVIKKIPHGLNHKIESTSSISSLGIELLQPTHIYVGAVEDLQNYGVDIHYAVNITGHGWRKLMRLSEPFTYRISDIGRYTPLIFNTLQKYGPISDEEAYGNFNMGAGFALYVDQIDVDNTLSLINSGSYGYYAWHAGNIEQGEKRVIIEPKEIVFESSTLKVR